MPKPSSIKFPYAFNDRTGGPVAPRRMLGNSEVQVYVPETDKGHLKCPHCLSASLHFNKGARSIAGDNLPGARPHFKTNPRSPHAVDCLAAVLIQDEHSDPDKIDYTKGFKGYLDLGELKQKFARHAQVVDRNKWGRLENRVPDLANREAFTAKSPKDFIRLMRSGQLERVNDTVIIHHDDLIPWKDFFIRKGGADSPAPWKRWIALAQSNLEGKHVPALFHLNLDGISPVEKINRNGKRLRYKLGTFVTVHPENGQKITVTPLLQVKNEHLFDQMKTSHEVLILATPRLYEGENTPGQWYMDICLVDPQKIVPVNLQEIALAARSKREQTAPAVPETP